MSIHPCPRCGKEFQRKVHLLNHLDKKNKCQEITVKLTDEPKKSLGNTGKSLGNTGKSLGNTGKSLGNTGKSLGNTGKSLGNTGNLLGKSENVPINTNVNKKTNIQCKYCNKTFTRNDNLVVHMSKICKKRPIDENEKITLLNQIQKLETEKQELEQKLKQNTTNTNINNNIVNNNNTNSNNTINNNNIQVININPRGQEDLTQFEELLYIAACRRGINSIPELVQRMHINKALPQFHNVFIPNNSNEAYIYDGNWERRDVKEVVNEMYEDKKQFLIDNHNNYSNLLGPIEMRNYETIMDFDKNKNTKAAKEYFAQTREKIEKVMRKCGNIVENTKNINENNVIV
jgi:hypothetical protein